MINKTYSFLFAVGLTVMLLSPGYALGEEEAADSFRVRKGPDDSLQLTPKEDGPWKAVNEGDSFEGHTVQAVSAYGAAGQTARRPNVVILFIDDLGYGDLGCFGANDIPTPNIDSLAKCGVKFTNSYITNPPCSPSRCSVMMGMYAQKFGKSGMARGLPIPDDKPTLAEFMRGAGYVTGQIGKWDIGSFEQGPLDRGFMEVARTAPGGYRCKKEDGSDAYRTDLDGDYMVEFVERNRNKPFFLYFSPLAVHSPTGGTPEEYCARTRARRARRTLAGAIVAVDDAVGKLLTALKKHGLENDTLIFLTGDNGPNLKEGGSAKPYRGGKMPGNTTYEGWVHTPGIVSWPRKIPSGGTYSGLTCALDYYATIAAACERPLPKHCDGVNLIPYLTGDRKGDAHEMIFWHNADPTDAPHRNLYAVRWKNWRLVKRGGTWQLFDMQSDPMENRNVAGQNADVVANMRKRYEAWIEPLPPIKESSSFDPHAGGRVPGGWGWATGTSGEEWYGSLGSGAKPKPPGSGGKKRNRKKKSRQGLTDDQQRDNNQ